MTMTALSQYLRNAADRHPGAKLPRHRKLEELARDGARWAELQPNGRWSVIDEAAADKALGLNAALLERVAA
jgi:hypothetical protein